MRFYQIVALLAPVGSGWIHETAWRQPKTTLLLRAQRPPSQQSLDPSQQAFVDGIEKALKRAKAKSVASGKAKEKRFCFKASHTAKGSVPLFDDEDKGVAEYMGLPLDTYNVNVASVDVVGSYVTFTDDGFRLELPLGGLMREAGGGRGSVMTGALDGLSLVCEVDVAHDPTRRANTLSCRRLAFELDARRVEEDARAKASDRAIIQSFNRKLNQTTAQMNTSATLSKMSLPPPSASLASNATRSTLVQPQAPRSAGPSQPTLPRAPDAAVPEVSSEVVGATAREFTRVLATAQIEVTGQAVVEWGVGGGFKFPAWQGSAGKHATTTTEQSPPSALVPLKLKAKGEVEFTAQGLLAWLPSVLVNGLGSALASAVLRVLTPRFLRLLGQDYGRWAQGQPRWGSAPDTDEPAKGAEVCAEVPPK